MKNIPISKFEKIMIFPDFMLFQTQYKFRASPVMIQNVGIVQFENNPCSQVFSRRSENNEFSFSDIEGQSISTKPLKE